MDDNMKLAWKHLRHPVKTLSSARCRWQAAWANRKLLYRGNRRFTGDPRYNLTNVTHGFSGRISDNASDRKLLQRICRAYSLAMSQEQIASAKYNPTPWWQQHRGLTLGPVMRALSSHDLDALQKMYENFFRDDCSTGLLPVQRVKKDYFDPVITDFYRRLYLVDALYRLDYWQAETSDRYMVRDLAGPATGNPFGVMLEDTLVRVGSEYQHYCAQRIAQLLHGHATIAEIGGGFGGMAYYLLRDRPKTTYINFDLPESLSLASYYLLKNFPNLEVVLYGEAELTSDTIRKADVVLMPIFELERMPYGAVNLSFSSHALSDLTPDVMPEYLSDIARITRDHFLYVGSEISAKRIADFSHERRGQFMLLESRPSGWNRHIAPSADHVERLYQINGSPAPPEDKGTRI
jgi:O-methyltransferase domain